MFSQPLTQQFGYQPSGGIPPTVPANGGTYGPPANTWGTGPTSAGNNGSGYVGQGGNFSASPASYTSPPANYNILTTSCTPTQRPSSTPPFVTTQSPFQAGANSVYRNSTLPPTCIPHDVSNRLYNSGPSPSPLGAFSVSSTANNPCGAPEQPVQDHVEWQQYVENPKYFEDPFGARKMTAIARDVAQGTARFSPTRYGFDPESSEVDYGQQALNRRAYVLNAVKTAASFSHTQLEQFFTTYGAGKIFYLRVKPPSLPPSVVFQHYHASPYTISDELADVRCTNRTPDWLLNTLNDIYGGPRRILDPSTAAVLQSFIDQDFDFGEIYGYLRPWWMCKHPTQVLDSMMKRKHADRAMRRSAMDGECIVNPRIPPRRVWDLHSNRVLPYFALNIEQPDHVPLNLWAVSHSWLQPSERQLVMTTINRHEWPVPIPQRTSLEHVRIELLNLGAEYVFLDVLCLRQKGEEYREFLRKKEWRLDVPTIGHVYQANWSQTIITYFNGLGLEFTFSPDIRASPTHWLNRVWTTQESGLNWIPGGLAANSPFRNASQINADFGAVLKKLVTVTRPPPEKLKLYHIIEVIRERCFTSELDRVASMAYLLRCETLPVYDETANVEHVWVALVEHMAPRLRTDLLVQWSHPGDRRWGLFNWLPSWYQLVDKENKLSTGDEGDPNVYAAEELLQFEHLGRLDNYDAYYHHAYYISESKVTTRVGYWDVTVEVPRAFQSLLTLQVRGQITPTENGGSFPHCLVGVQGGMSWVVGRVIGKTTVEKNQGPVVQKIGVVWMDFAQGNNLIDSLIPSRQRTFVTYV